MKIEDFHASLVWQRKLLSLMERPAFGTFLEIMFGESGCGKPRFEMAVDGKKSVMYVYKSDKVFKFYEEQYNKLVAWGGHIYLLEKDEENVGQYISPVGALRFVINSMPEDTNEEIEKKARTIKALSVFKYALASAKNDPEAICELADSVLDESGTNFKLFYE